MLNLILVLNYALISVFLFIIDPAIVQGAALAAAGFLAVPITEGLKRFGKFSQGAALILAGVVSLVLTLGAVFATGQFAGFKDLVASSAIVFTISQAVFKVLLADKSKSTITPNDLR